MRGEHDPARVVCVSTLADLGAGSTRETVARLSCWLEMGVVVCTPRATLHPSDAPWITLRAVAAELPRAAAGTGARGGRPRIAVDLEIARALVRTRSVLEAASLLGVSESTLRRRLAATES
jgi:hypothetical protein